MNDNGAVDVQKLDEFKDKVLILEKESISNINKTDDRQMVSKIVNAYEEFIKNADK
jgi:hypothetical protein